MGKEKGTSELTDVVEESKSAGGYMMTVDSIDRKATVCSCGQAEDTVLYGKVQTVKHTLIDKIKEGLDNGHNTEHLVNLSKIYSNLSF